jgi:S1-C subfamily serine protease
VLRRAQEVTVRIRSLGCAQFGLGSGFVLPGGVVVTNRHVVEQPREVTVNTWDGRSLIAEVEGIAIDSDLAILQLGGAGDLPGA